MSKHTTTHADRPTVPMVLEPPAEWMPLDALVQQWADFARHPAVMNALTLELVSDALLGLAAEMSAQPRRVGRLLLQVQEEQVQPARRPRRPLHGTVYIGLTLLCMVVGHQDSAAHPSHFLASTWAGTSR